MTPWSALSPPKPGRFRPGWTRELDRMAKRRKSLHRSKEPGDLEEAKRLDKAIKRQFRRNVKRLRSELGDTINEGCISNQFQTLRRALALSPDRQDWCCPNVSPDEFPRFMDSLQPAAEASPWVEVLPFAVPDSLGDVMEKALCERKRGLNKSPVPDGVRYFFKKSGQKPLFIYNGPSRSGA